MIDQTQLSSNGILFAQLCARKAALKLEILGMRRRGRSVYSICKEAYGLKGNKQSVLNQVQKIVDACFDELETRKAQTR